MNIIGKASKVITLIVIFFFSLETGQAKSYELAKETDSSPLMGISELKYSQLRVNNIDINYTELGAGEPIIFIHGWSADSGNWLEQLEHFSKTHRAIAYDWRGMGKSAGADEPYEFDQLADDLKGFIDMLELDKPIIVGQSQGGVTALHFAAKYPKVPSAIISADAPGEDNFVTGRFMYWVLNSSTSITRFLNDETALSIQIPLNAYFFFSPGFKEASPSKLKHWEKQFVTNSPLSLVHAMRALTYRSRL
jgi:pimeloyl-ACP methyl ester carboxylesterase